MDNQKELLIKIICYLNDNTKEARLGTQEHKNEVLFNEKMQELPEETQTIIINYFSDIIDRIFEALVNSPYMKTE